MHNERYPLAIMNDTEPPPSDVAGFEDDPKGHKVKPMLYNGQASEPAAGRLARSPKSNGSGRRRL